METPLAGEASRCLPAKAPPTARCSALPSRRGRCSVSNVDMNEDIKATVAAVTALGVQACYDDASCPFSRWTPLDWAGRTLSSTVGNPALPCGFLIPIAAALGVSARFEGPGQAPLPALGSV